MPQRPWLAGSLLLAFLASGGCQRQPAGPGAAPAKHERDEPAGPPLFEDVTAASGVDFTYRNGEDTANAPVDPGVARRRRRRSSTTTATACSTSSSPAAARFGGAGQEADRRATPCKLYRNLGGWKFQDVTAAAGLDKLAGGEPWFYTHGVAVADYDRDGWPDLLVTGWGARRAVPQRARRSADPRKGRRFEDVTAKAGLDTGITWATSAAFADLDGDGYPDLYVCQYVDWSLDNHPRLQLRRQDARRLPAEELRRPAAQALPQHRQGRLRRRRPTTAGLRPGRRPATARASAWWSWTSTATASRTSTSPTTRSTTSCT